MESFVANHIFLSELLLFGMVVFAFLLGGSMIYSLFRQPENSLTKTKKVKKGIWFNRTSRLTAWGYYYPVTWQGWLLSFALLASIIFIFRFHYIWYIGLPILFLVAFLYNHIVHKKSN